MSLGLLSLAVCFLVACGVLTDDGAGSTADELGSKGGYGAPAPCPDGRGGGDGYGYGDGDGYGGAHDQGGYSGGDRGGDVHCGYGGCSSGG